MKPQRILRNILKAAGLVVFSLLILFSPVIFGIFYASAPHIIKSADGGDRIESQFYNMVTRDHMEKHKFRIVGIGDTFDYWKLKNINSVTENLIIENFKLKPHEYNNDLFSKSNPPRWWPKSTSKFNIYESGEGYLGSIELWMPIEGSQAYLFHFLE